MRAAVVIVLLGSGCAKPTVVGNATSNTGLTADTHSPFPIGHDAKHGGTDCNACHGNFNSFQEFSCTSGCHEQAACDAGHPALPGYQYDSAKCLSCHPGGTADGAFANHPFPIGVTAVHSGISCSTCHIVPGDYSQFSCTTSCHAQSATDPFHPGLADYAYSSPKCLACHPQGIAAGGAAHTQFPIGPGTKHDLGCTQCHTDVTQPHNAANFKCATCHASIDPTLLTRHTANTTSSIHVKANEISTTDSRTCLRCHADYALLSPKTTVTTLVSPTNAHPKTKPCASAGAPPHHGAGCTQCHSGYRTDKTYAASFENEVGSTPSAPPGCKQCHQNGQTCN